MWTLGVFVLLVVGIGFLVAAQTTNEDLTDVPYTIPAFFGLILGQICLITLGVLVVSSEYGTGMIRTTFTASPQRYRVLTAKLMIFFVVAFVVSALSIRVVGLLTSWMHGGSSDNEWGGTVLMGALYVSLLGVLALAVGSMLRHSAGAITAMLGVVLVPAILPAFLLMSESMRTIGEKMLEYNAPNALARIFRSTDNGNGGSQLVSPRRCDRGGDRRGLRAAGEAGRLGIGDVRKFVRRSRTSGRSWTAAPVWCGGPSRSSRPCASASARPRRSARARPPRAARPEGICWSQPGQRYVLPCALAPATCRTLHASPCQLSDDCQPPYRSDGSEPSGD